MQPAVESRTVTARGVASAASFGMRSENSAHIFNILRSTLYSNKVLAVLREYSANAWDEHRAAGIPDRPIKVVIPTALEPTLRIRDYGRGLSEQQVFEVYTQYGSSTKRDSDDVVGCLGIGSKSAFAYADAFTVTSWHGGSKSVYVAVLDETNVGTMSLMHREPCDPSETGVEISLAVDVSDCVQFRREAEDLFPHFVPRPDINLTLNKSTVIERSKHGGLGGNRWVAVMGCIPYALDLSSVRDNLVNKGLYSLAHHAGVLRFDIGEVSISASRETLEYTNRTKEAIVRKVDALVADLREQVEWIAIDPSLTDWERRLSVCNVSRAFGSYIRSKWAQYEVSLFTRGGIGSDDNSPKTFTMRRLGRYSSKPPEGTWNVDVSEKTRIVIRDVNRSHQGYQITHEDRIVYPSSRTTTDATLAELDTFLKDAGLHGIPVVRMSEMPYTATVRRKNSHGVVTPAKAERHFVLKATALGSYNRSAPSSNWESVAHTPSDADVYVVLDGFRPPDDWRFSSQVSSDRNVLEWLGQSMPPIIGHRKSAKNPVAGVPGTPYDVWRVDALRRALEANSEKLAAFRNFQRQEFYNSMRGWRYQSPSSTALAELLTALTPGGAMHEFLTSLRDTVAVSRDSYLRTLSDVVPNEVQVEAQAVYDRYPLLDPANGGPTMSVLLEAGPRVHWIAYINLVDRT